MALRVVDLHGPLWRRFTAGQVHESVFHTPEWGEVLGSTYGFRLFGLVLEDNGVVSAGLPVAEVSNFRRRRWIALPFTDACPILGTEHARLLGEADLLRRELGVGTVEVRGPADGVGESRQIGVDHRLTLAESAEEMLAMLGASQTRRNITRAEREGVVVTIERERASLDVFYDLHLKTRRRQGVPIQPRRFFGAIRRQLVEPGKAFVAVARSHGRAVAAAVILDHRETMTYKFGASAPDALQLRPNHAVIWEVIRWGIDHGRRELDFGRSDMDNAGLRAFKSGWGAEESPLVYTVVGGPAPHPGRSPRVLSSFIRASPPAVCRVIGEALYRYSA